ncbi:MAG: endonuclease/exonuclease/phosphatase family protein [Armatimonadetes bacterium]|nr:endonuclease/exonuclease/phosphatase family protein [Armatimonadota bacterium]
MRNATAKHFSRAPHVTLYQSKPRSRRSQAEPETVTVGTYNVKNMFDHLDQNPREGNKAKPEKELEALARVIERSGADVVALQEVENREVLQHFVDEYLAGEFTDVVLVEGNDGRGIDVALISKFPVTDAVSHKDNVFPLPDGSGTTQFRRDALRVDVDIPGYPMSVYTVHLKSRLGGPEATAQRQAEASELRRVVNQEMAPFPKHNFVVTGDFNDSPPTETLRRVLQGEAGDEPLVDVLEGKPWDERDTWPSRGPNRQFDFVIMPEHMGDNLVDSRVHQYPESKRASDHLMVTATLRTNSHSTG